MTTIKEAHGDRLTEANMLFTRMIIPAGYLVLERRKPEIERRLQEERAKLPSPVSG